MGLGRRVVRKSVRRVTPRPVRQARHPARTVRNAVTPRPVKVASRAAYTVRHPVGAAENKAIGAVLHPPRRRRRSLLSWLTGGFSIEQPSVQPRSILGRLPSPPPASAARPAAPATTSRPAGQGWPARQGLRTPPPGAPPAGPPSAEPQFSAGQWELDARRYTGLGDGSRKER